MKRTMLLALLSVVIIFNAVCFMHAYRFTHFSSNKIERTADPQDLSVVEKMKILFTGIDNPKPLTKALPEGSYKTVYINSDVMLEAWHMNSTSSKGTVLLFHGYAGEKSSLLDRAAFFISLGYSTLLVDFKGSGGSAGSTTSIGYHESEEVNACYQYLVDQGEKNVILFGTSMGSAAILKFLHHHSEVRPSAVVLECPFGSLYNTTCARFDNMHVPSFPAAGVMLFWGGVQNNFWPFGHNPQRYAKDVTVPTLILYGTLDDRVIGKETDTIFNNLKGKKKLAIYPDRGHNDLFGDEWQRDVKAFLTASGD